MGGAFEPFVDTFLTPLMRNTVVTIAVISRSSHAAVVTILMAAPTPKAVPRLLTGMMDRSATLRTRRVAIKGNGEGEWERGERRRFG
jgi:hypothetical protein